MNLSIKDECVLEEFIKCIKSGGQILHTIPRKNKSKIRGKFVNGGVISTFRFNNKKIAGDLMKLGLKPRKSLTLEWPKIDEKYYYSFLRGYIDGDGCICFRKDKRCQLSIFSSSMFLLEMIKFIKRDLNINMGFYKTKSAIHSSSTGNQNNVLKILNRVYEDNNGYPRLDRKYQKYLKIKENLTNNPISQSRVTTDNNGSMIK